MNEAQKDTHQKENTENSTESNGIQRNSTEFNGSYNSGYLRGQMKASDLITYTLNHLLT